MKASGRGGSAAAAQSLLHRNAGWRPIMTRLLAVAALLLLALSAAEAATFASQNQTVKSEGRTLSDYNIQKE
jgi:hypothetical protein